MKNTGLIWAGCLVLVVAWVGCSREADACHGPRRLQAAALAELITSKSGVSPVYFLFNYIAGFQHAQLSLLSDPLSLFTAPARRVLKLATQHTAESHSAPRTRP